MSKTLPCILLALSALPGCSAAQWISTPDDYGAYRRVRLATGTEAQLQAQWKYLEVHPKGAWAPEVKRRFVALEQRHLEGLWDNLDALRRYVRLSPAAPRAAEVRARIRQLVVSAAERRKQDRQRLEKAKAYRQEVGKAAAARAAFVNQISQKLALLAALPLGSPPADVPYSLGLECEKDQCSGRFSYAYRLAEAKGFRRIHGSVEIELSYQRGKLLSWVLSGEDLTYAIGVALKPQADTDPPLLAALSWARVSSSFRKGLKEGECSTTKAQELSPQTLQCGNATLMLRQGLEAEPDRLTLSPNQKR